MKNVVKIKGHEFQMIKEMLLQEKNFKAISMNHILSESKIMIRGEHLDKKEKPYALVLIDDAILKQLPKVVTKKVKNNRDHEAQLLEMGGPEFKTSYEKCLFKLSQVWEISGRKMIVVEYGFSPDTKEIFEVTFEVKGELVSDTLKNWKRLVSQGRLTLNG